MNIIEKMKDDIKVIIVDEFKDSRDVDELNLTQITSKCPDDYLTNHQIESYLCKSLGYIRLCEITLNDDKTVSKYSTTIFDKNGDIVPRDVYKKYIDSTIGLKFNEVEERFLLITDPC